MINFNNIIFKIIIKKYKSFLKEVNNSFFITCKNKIAYKIIEIVMNFRTQTQRARTECHVFNLETHVTCMTCQDISGCLPPPHPPSHRYYPKSHSPKSEAGASPGAELRILRESKII